MKKAHGEMVEKGDVQNRETRLRKWYVKVHRIRECQAYKNISMRIPLLLTGELIVVVCTNVLYLADSVAYGHSHPKLAFEKNIV